MKVTLQLPVTLNKGVTGLFERPDTELSVPPYPGLLVHGLGVRGQIGHSNVVRHVHADLDKGIVTLLLHRVKREAYDPEEYLRELGHGWILPPGGLSESSGDAA